MPAMEWASRSRRPSWAPGTRTCAVLFDTLEAVFLSHLHSDHVSDLYNILGTGLQTGVSIPERVLQIFGPGNRGALPVSYQGKEIPKDQVVNPSNPTPGTRETIEALVKAFATDFNDRIIDSGYPPPREYFVGRDIDLPANLAAIRTETRTRACARSTSSRTTA